MKRDARQIILAYVLWIGGMGTIARASLLFTLDAATFSGSAANSVDIAGTLANPETDPIFVNALSGILTSPDLTFDLTDFLTLVPGVFNPGDSYVGPIVTVAVDGQAVPGDYFGSITLQGGPDANTFDDLATQNFQFTVANVPEPSPRLLFGAGVITLLTAHFWLGLKKTVVDRRKLPRWGGL